MLVDLALLPSMLTLGQLTARAVVVFDVLRATTSMTAALVAGVSEIRVYPDLAAAARGAGAARPDRLLCGEERCLPPAGFDLGNSPGAFTAEVAGRVMHLSTTNGTRAIVAAGGARAIYCGALVNASAVAVALVERGLDVTLLCAGTNDTVSADDLLGAGAVLDAMTRLTDVQVASDSAWVGLHLFRAEEHNLHAALSATRSGHNIQNANLTPDIDYAARLNVLDVVGVIDDPGAVPPVVRRLRLPSRLDAAALAGSDRASA